MATAAISAVPVIARADQSSIISDPACEAAKNSTAPSGTAVPAGCDGKTTLDGGGKGSTSYLSILIDAFVYVGAAVSVIFIIVGGVRYMTSTGDAGRIQKAKDSVLYAVIGLVVVLLVRLLIGFLVVNVKV